MGKRDRARGPGTDTDGRHPALGRLPAPEEVPIDQPALGRLEIVPVV